MPGLSLYLLNARYLFFVPSKREIACRRRRRRIFSTSRVARLKSAQKNARQKRTYKKKEDRESNCTWRFSASFFRHASRAKSARTTSSSSSSPALDPLLRVLATKTKKRYNTRTRVCCHRRKKKDDTYLGGTNAFSPSTLPPCDPGAPAYARSSKSKLCSLAGVRPGILCGILSLPRKSSSKVVVQNT